ncbi:MAG: bifunctional heptose 7-phosphate kinase/heptose 1-phosphate adenyltransferase [Luteolibacter sp.]
MTTSEILQRLPGLNILVIGDLMLDHYIWGDVHRISPEAPVPVVHASRDTFTAGGAANVALNLASIGVKAAVIGTVGNDEHAKSLLGLLEDAGIDASGCVGSDEVSTIVKTRVIVRTQQLCRIDREAARSGYALKATDILEKMIQDTDALIVSDYAKGVITQELLDQIFSIAKKAGKLVAVDPKPARKLRFTGAGLITPNRHEALELAGLTEPAFGDEYPLDEVCEKIHEVYAPQLLIVTLGADGMAVCQGGKVIRTLPTNAREVFDVSGAGDTVIASLTAALAAGSSPVEAAQFANIAAGIVVSKVGTATTTAEELLDTVTASA